VSVVPGGAWPSYALGYSTRDNDFYQQWDAVSRDRGSFLAWAKENGLEAVADV
jgi:glutaconate CoA-transferase subunit A